jgi:osmotically-inducible protein OsmY
MLAVRAAVVGTLARRRHRRSHPDQTIDDVTLVHKVESELSRNAAFSRGVINLNAQFGVVVIRGQLHDIKLIRSIEDCVRRVEGVRGVINLTHLPNTPAPNKQASLEA